jgi:hypothetical protein
MSDPLPAPSFANLAFDVKPTDIGTGYAQGITEAGKSLSSAISSISDIAKQNIDANDTLSAMKAGNILPKDAYESVMGKSLGAKQQMLGLYAGQYIADQAAKRAQDLQMGKSSADIHTEHAKLLDTINAVKGGYGAAVGVQPGKLPAAAPVRAQPPVAPQVQPAQPALTSSISGAPSPWAQTGTTGTLPPPPPQLKTIGPPMGLKDVIPLGASLRQIKGPKGDIVDGVLMPDGTFRPRPLR